MLHVSFHDALGTNIRQIHLDIFLKYFNKKVNVFDHFLLYSVLEDGFTSFFKIIKWEVDETGVVILVISSPKNSNVKSVLKQIMQAKLKLNMDLLADTFSQLKQLSDSRTCRHLLWLLTHTQSTLFRVAFLYILLWKCRV